MRVVEPGTAIFGLSTQVLAPEPRGFCVPLHIVVEAGHPQVCAGVARLPGENLLIDRARLGQSSGLFFGGGLGELTGEFVGLRTGAPVARLRTPVSAASSHDQRHA